MIKKEPEDEHKIPTDTEDVKPFVEPQFKKVKTEYLSPDTSDIPKHTDQQQVTHTHTHEWLLSGLFSALVTSPFSNPKDKLLYPPLPSTTFPSVLNIEAASYNIPQRPEVHLALIREPPGLSVLWKVGEEDPHAPPMCSYR